MTNNPFRILKISSSDTFIPLINIDGITVVEIKDGGRKFHGRKIDKFPVRNFFRTLVGMPLIKPRRGWSYWTPWRICLHFPSKPIIEIECKSCFEVMKTYDNIRKMVDDHYGEQTPEFTI